MLSAEGLVLYANRRFARMVKRPLARVMNWLAGRLNLRELAIPLNFGDLVTAYARKRTTVSGGG